MVIRTAHNALFVIDGGDDLQAATLDKFIRVYMGFGTGTINIAAWFATHPHGDHVSAMLKLMDPSKPFGDYAIGTVYSSNWPQSYNSFTDVLCLSNEKPVYNAFYSYIHSSSVNWRNVDADGAPTPSNRVVYCTGGIIVELFNSLASGDYTTINDASLVFKISNNVVGHPTFLITGDLNIGGAGQICGTYNCNAGGVMPFKADILQMAHHGQNGEGNNALGNMFPQFVQFYKGVNPTKCLWPSSPDSFLTMSNNAVLKFMACGASGYEFGPTANCAQAMVPLKSNHIFAFCYDNNVAAALNFTPINTSICSADYYTNIRECLCSSSSPNANFVIRQNVPVIA